MRGWVRVWERMRVWVGVRMRVRVRVWVGVRVGRRDTSDHRKRDKRWAHHRCRHTLEEGRYTLITISSML